MSTTRLYPMHPAVLELKQQLINCYGDRLARFIVYGSYARGDYTPESDIDILVTLKGQVDRQIKNEVLEIYYAIELEYEVVFDVKVYSEEAVQNTILGATPLMESISREGVAV